MKKVFIFVLTLTLLLSFNSSCHFKDQGSSSQESSSTEEVTTSFVFPEIERPVDVADVGEFLYTKELYTDVLRNPNKYNDVVLVTIKHTRVTRKDNIIYISTDPESQSGLYSFWKNNFPNRKGIDSVTVKMLDDTKNRVLSGDVISISGYFFIIDGEYYMTDCRYIMVEPYR